MSWIERCYEVYENNAAFIGDMHTGKVPLVPFAHTIVLASVEVRLNHLGEFKGARILGPEEQTTITPCSETSMSRTRNIEPHFLSDKLQYVAGDYKKFGGSKREGWDRYIKQLQLWCDSPYSSSKVQAVLTYLKKGTLIEDLVKEKILFIDDKNKLIRKWEGKAEEKPTIFNDSKKQDDISVKFLVDGSDISQDKSTWQDFIKYYKTTLNEKNFCYVTGKETIVSTFSPAKIRRLGDRAKLISHNGENFTYWGRFKNHEDAYGVGIEVNQKAHSALRWLIGLQGQFIHNKKKKIIENLVFLAWGTKNEKTPNIIGDSYNFIRSGNDWDSIDDIDNVNETSSVEDDEEVILDTKEVLAKAFNKALAGYKTELTPSAQISVIILDSASKGRLSIRYYKELSGSRLMENLENWHHTYKWQMSYRKIKGKNKNGKDDIRITFIGAPSPEDIAKAAYGELVDDKLKQQTVERIMPCIIDGKLLPRDILRAVVNRAVHSIGLKRWDAYKTQQIACALLCGYYQKRYKEVFSMAVDESIKDRSYVFGRILACAEQVERHAQKLANPGTENAGNKRPTNAERLMFAYTLHPVNTLTVLQEKLRPYIDRIKASTGSDPQRYVEMLRLISELGVQNYTNDKLGDKFLLGYASQKIQFIEDNKNSKRDESAING